MNKKSINAGVEALAGFEFQRNCALYLLLDDYSSFEDKDFFLCIEHYDDFLFCFLSKDNLNIESVKAYQAKKLSGKIWKIDKRFIEIVNKILCVGIDLKNDDLCKNDLYNHNLTFISNTEFELNYKPKKTEKDKKEILVRINEVKPIYNYKNEIHTDIKSDLEVKLNEYCLENSLIYNESELDNFFMQWLDFPRTQKRQKDQLIGLMRRKFSHVSDPVAAIDLLLNLFRDVETVYNNGNIIQLMDESKRVEGEIIKKAINIIGLEQATFNLWRDMSKEIILKFKIPLAIQKNIEIQIKTTFELFKDMSNFEHQIIRDYVGKNDYSQSYYNYPDMFQGYVDDIRKNSYIGLRDFEFLLACLCSFVEYYGG